MALIRQLVVRAVDCRIILVNGTVALGLLLVGGQLQAQAVAMSFTMTVPGDYAARRYKLRTGAELHAQMWAG